jgi:predicted alpha/beta superfamily hydrolase
MKVLLPIDGSKSSLNAAKYVAKMAKNSRSPTTVTLVSVHDDSGLGYVKQFVDKTYRTKPFREDTAIAGSSMGGLIALYGGLRYGQYFGKVGAFSPSLWFNPAVLDLTTKTAWKSKIYAVSSKTEMKSVEKTMHNMYWSLKKGNYSDEQLRIILRDRGKHNEIFWSKEFKKMIEWMF